MFISFEGTEGVGKTTLIRKIHQYFEQQGKQVLLTREPGGTPLAEQIRSLLLAVNHEEQMSHDTELLLIYAARAQHLQQGRSDCRRIRVRGDRQIAFERREVTIRFFEISASCTVKYRRSIFEHTA